MIGKRFLKVFFTSYTEKNFFSSIFVIYSMLSAQRRLVNLVQLLEE